MLIPILSEKDLEFSYCDLISRRACISCLTTVLNLICFFPRDLSYTDILQHKEEVFYRNNLSENNFTYDLKVEAKKVENFLWQFNMRK
jgi:hypothetical protein